MTSSIIDNNFEKRVLIMAGGTGGHIFPGLAVATELQKRDWNVHWLGSQNGMEEGIIGKTSIPLSLIKIKGLRGNGLLGWLKAPFLIVKSVASSIAIIRKIKPQLVIGFGGFASGPGGVASFLLGIKLFIHEQNAIAGMTNRFLSKLANKVFLGFPNAFSRKSEKKFSVVGNPIREEIKTFNRIKVESESELNVLVLGGSRGAKMVNQKIPKILASIDLNLDLELRDKESFKIIHQCGKGNQQETINGYKELNCDAKIVEFIDNIEESLSWADVVICRAGASSVAEIAAVGLAAIFIPFPYAVDDHQYFNALWLEDKGAAIIVRENELDSIESKGKIEELLRSRKSMLVMGIKAKEVAYLNAAEKIANECDKLLQDNLKNWKSKAA